MMNKNHSGGCLCGAVRYSVGGALRGVIYCHCTQCQKQTGHFYAATNCRSADIEISGADKLTWYRASDEAQRGFCARCGSALFWRRDGAETISVLAGSFDRSSELIAERHIFVADKRGYYTIDDGLPQFPQAG